MPHISCMNNMNCLPVWGSWLSGSYWYLQTGFILMAQDWLGVRLSRSTPLGWLERLNTALCPLSPSGLVQSNSWESQGPAGRKPNHSCTYSASVCAMFVSILLAKVSYQTHWASWSGKVNCSSFVGKYHQVIWWRIWLGRGRELGSWIQSVYCRAPALELSGVIVIILMPESYNVWAKVKKMQMLNHNGKGLLGHIYIYVYIYI